jgi:2-desacetyl-2-hydroxyethyl bacteriochlorophyllide A dehydrogenase
MRAAVVTAPGTVRVEERPDPDVEPGQVLVRTRLVGICGTDVAVVGGGVPVRLPRVMGHEMVGEVVHAPEDSGVRTGDRVVVDPSLACGACDPCRRDLKHLCVNGGLMGRDRDGCFADLLVARADALHAVPPGLTLRDAAFVQVLSTCVHAQRLLGADLPELAVVVGLGVTGLLHVQLLLAAGVETVVGVGRSPGKLARAAALGAVVVTPEAAADAVGDLSRGAGSRVVVESAGRIEALRTASCLAAPGGDLLLFGTISPDADGVPTYDWYRKELRVLNTRAARPDDLEEAVALLAGGRVRPGDLVTAEHPFEEVALAVAAAAEREQLKVLMSLGG